VVRLEHWDSVRGRWVLYPDQQDNSADCTRYPFEGIPRRIFLDTNVVNLLVKRGPHIFEQEPLPATLDTTSAWDTKALMHVFQIGARATWDLVVSTKTIDEISRTRNASVREDLLAYAFEVVDTHSEDSAFAADFGRRLADAPLVAALPDRADRELLGNAIGLGCDVFCTSDRSTIVSKRDLLPQLPLRILTPVEWWAHVKPWGGLWC
jgi:hypothetical protein